MKIAIVGGGIVGLTTALQLKRELRNTAITVYAENFDDTTSHVAAGIFRIGGSFFGPTEEITRAWIHDSWSYYDEIRKSRESSEAGVTGLSCFMFSNSERKAVRNYWMEDLWPIYKSVDREDFNTVGGSWKYGAYFSTIVTHGKNHLPWARKKLRENGVTMVERKVDSLVDLMNDHKLIINCSGLGARELCNDRHVIPIHGQVIKVQAPWIKTAFYGELDTYVIPGVNGSVTLGGSRSFDSTNLDVCPHETAAIHERCIKLIPSLSKAKVLSYATGLRPFRQNNVRVELEKMSNGRSHIVVVHNYGHGGYGICTAPGTAKYAVGLVKQAHVSSGSK